MTKREKRVVDAFLNCIAHGEFTVDYAITVIEDHARYGWLSEKGKDYFYEHLEPGPNDNSQEENENAE